MHLLTPDPQAQALLLRMDSRFETSAAGGFVRSIFATLPPDLADFGRRHTHTHTYIYIHLLYIYGYIWLLIMVNGY